MHTLVKHEGEVVGRVFHSNSLTTTEMLRLAGIDPTEMQGGDPRWDWDKFEFETLTDQEYKEYKAKNK